MITPGQCRAARALLDWTTNELARRARLTGLTIQAFERGRDRNETTVQAITTTLETAGAVHPGERWRGRGAAAQGERDCPAMKLSRNSFSAVALFW